MGKPGDIDINDYDYELPEDRIASRPAARREDARLLMYQKGEIGESIFAQLPDKLPPNALLLFNNTKVIEARLPFHRPSGARIELFCLEPVKPVEHQLSLSSHGPVVWSCLIGNNRRWKEESLERAIKEGDKAFQLQVKRLGARDGAFDIEFRWDDPGLTFAEVLHLAGRTPLPPYIKREDEPQDRHRYQTVYAELDGSVAAPTAGLHFTPEILRQLEQKGFQRQTITLHVGAGTFLPVKADRLQGHDMHREKISISLQTLKALHHAALDSRPIIPVGTTSMRVLESLYWHGLSLCNGRSSDTMDTTQWEPFENHSSLPSHEALARILKDLTDSGGTELRGQTRLLIAPGYRFRLATGLVTNFHQPRSTLLLLIAALLGEDWKRLYQYAIEQEFRFLSYGDSCLLLP